MREDQTKSTVTYHSDRGYNMGAWAISLMGFVIVFLGLGILYFIMIVQTRIFFKNKKETRAPKPKKVETITSSVPVIEKVETVEEVSITELEQAAAIAAVIAYMEAEGIGSKNIVVRSVKPIKYTKNSWKTREALVYWSKKRTRGVKRW